MAKVVIVCQSLKYCVYFHPLNKKPEILNLIDEDNPDILAFTELLDKTDPELSEAELKINGYETFYGSNPQRGVVIYAKEDLNPKRFNEFDHTNFSEQVWCTIKDESILIGNIYKSPHSSEENKEELLNLIKSDIFNRFQKVYITGDFNYPNIKWDGSYNSEKDQIFIERHLEMHF